MQRRAMHIIGAAAHQIFKHVKRQGALGSIPIDHFAHFGHHFWANTIAGQNKKGGVCHFQRFLRNMSFCKNGRVGKRSIPSCHAQLVYEIKVARLHPRVAYLQFAFIGIDGRSFFHRQADIVQTVQQAMLFERIHLEGKGFPIRGCDGLRVKINLDARV